MEIRKIVFGKGMKLVTLLLTSLLIASASAAVYYSLIWQPSVTTTALTVQFADGADKPSGSTVNPSWVRLLLKSYPNATLTYEKALNISNTDGSSAHGISLRHVSITPSEPDWDIGNFTSIKFTILAKNGTTVFTFEYTTSSGNSWNEPSATAYYWIAKSEEWTIKVETLSPANAQAGKEANIQIALDVKE